MGVREEEAYRAASMYYIQGQTMETIARHLGVSRSSVSRLLSHARDTGLVRITLAAAPGGRGTLAGDLGALFRVEVTVVPVRESATEVSCLAAVAKVAGERLRELVVEDTVLGIGWGNTTAEVVRQLTYAPVRGTKVVQLNGAASPMSTGIPFAGAIVAQAAEAFGAAVMQFPVPALFDYPETRDAMWRERSVRRVVATQKQVDVALFGIGSAHGHLPSHVYAAGYLDNDDLAQLRRDRVVGDVCTVFLREDGTFADVELNRRASGPTPAELKALPHRLAVVSGVARTAATIAALRAGAITELVIDDVTAQAILDRCSIRNGRIRK